MQMISKGKRKTPNDGAGKMGKTMSDPGMMNPVTTPSKGMAMKGPCKKKKSKGMGY